MPRRELVDDLIRHTIEARFVEAMEKFYHEDVIMQENCMPPRVGRAASIARQIVARAQVGAIHEIKAGVVLIEGNRVAIEWHAEWSMPDATRVRVEEVALQQWKGDRIIHERFFYDATPMCTEKYIRAYR